jgi:N-acetyl-1-D-myo-inositol-2-amino-2-deoxy-alpha-D-glucopyranoside deacetylase
MRRLLVVVAHPDDETFGCGSLIIEAVARGYEVTVACATRGELGESAIEVSDLAAVREQELRAAAEVLGVHHVELLGWRDSGVDGDPAPGSLCAADPDAVTAAVAAVVADVHPDVLVTLDGGDGHRDHAVARDAAIAAAGTIPVHLSCLPRSLLAPFLGNPEAGTPDELVTCHIDTSAHLEQRWRAIRCHRSQVPPFDHMDEETQRAFLTVERLRRV